jgi:hypothetical protein
MDLELDRVRERWWLKRGGRMELEVGLKKGPYGVGGVAVWSWRWIPIRGFIVRQL